MASGEHGHGRRVAEQATAPSVFAEALREAIARRDVSLEWLHRRLADLGTPVSMGTLSYWRSGQRNPEHASSLAAVASLEELLHLPPHHLSARLGRARRSGPHLDSADADQVMAAGTGRFISERLGLSRDDVEALAEVTHDLVVDIDTEGRARRTTSRVLWRALRDGVASTCNLVRTDREQAPRPEFAAVAGCRLSPLVDAPDLQMAGVVMTLERPLRLGEMAMTEVSMTLPPDTAPDDCYELSVRRRMSDVLIWVRFDPARVPRSCEAYACEHDHVVDVAHIDMGRQTTAHHRFSPAEPGWVGLRWIW